MATSSSSTSFFGSRDGTTIIQPPPPPQEPPQLHLQNHHLSVAEAPPSSSSTPPQKKIKRNLPGAPLKYPDADVILLSPRSLMATNRFICEVCNKGFQREQNLQLHRRGHNLPWKLKQKNKEAVRKKVYLCPETTCVHHDAARALGDLTGIKKHYFRKHGEKKFKCEKCSKRYAVQSDWKAHSKTCGTREYRCDCGTLFSRRDSFITHRAFCDALAQESARLPTSLSTLGSHMFSTAGLTGNNSIGLGMRLPHQMPNNNHLPSLSDHQMASDILRLGGGSRQFDHLFTNSFQSQQQQQQQQQQQNIQSAQSNFYLSDGQSQTDYHDQNNNQLFHGQVNQMSNFQQESASTNPSFGNVRFYAGNDNSTTDTNTMNSGSTGSGDHSSAILSPGAIGGLFGGPPQMSLSGGLSSLYRSSPAPHQQSAMSATALLQRAAKMGPTTSTTNVNETAQLKSFGAKTPPPPQQPSSPSGGGGGGGFRGLYGEHDRNNLHDLLIRDLSRDNHLLMSSTTLFDHLQGNNNNNSLNYSGNEYINNNNYDGLNSKNKSTKDGVTIALSDQQTRDFLGVGEIVRRSMNSGAGFTPRVEEQHHQCGHINNNMVNFDNVDHINNNNNNNNNSSNNNNNSINNTTGATSSQAYHDGGDNSFQ